jgi:predicted nucleic acid-binding protein
LIFEVVTLIPKVEYEHIINEMKSEISDPKDIPYLACCIATNSEGVWSHDPHIKEQKKVKVFTNIDMLKSIRS